MNTKAAEILASWAMKYPMQQVGLLARMAEACDVSDTDPDLVERRYLAYQNVSTPPGFYPEYEKIARRDLAAQVPESGPSHAGVLMREALDYLHTMQEQFQARGAYAGPGYSAEGVLL